MADACMAGACIACMANACMAGACIACMADIACRADACMADVFYVFDEGNRYQRI